MVGETGLAALVVEVGFGGRAANALLDHRIVELGVGAGEALPLCQVKIFGQEALDALVTRPERSISRALAYLSLVVEVSSPRAVLAGI